MATIAEEIKSGFDAEQKRLFFSLFGELGVPTVLFATLASYALHVKMKCRLDRSLSFVAQNRSSNESLIKEMSSNLGMSPQVLLWWNNFAVQTLLLAPLCLCISWSIVVAVTCTPSLIGFGMLFLFPGFSFVVIAIFDWKSRGWYFSPISRRLYGFGILSVSIFQTVSVFLVKPLSFVGLSWVFLGFNMLPMVRVVYLLLDEPKDHPGYYLWEAQNHASNTAICNEQGLELSMHKIFDYLWGVDVDYQEAIKSIKERKIAASVLYIFSVILLGFYSYINYFLAENDIDSGKNLAFAVSLSILVLDGILYLMYKSKDIVSNLFGKKTKLIAI